MTTIMIPTQSDTLHLFFDKLTDQNETLSFEHFSQKLEEANIKLSKQQIKEQWDIIDVDHSNDMDFDEFQALMRRNFESGDHKVIVQQAFINIYKCLMPNGDELLSPTSRVSLKVSFNVAMPLKSSTMKQQMIQKQEWDEKLNGVFKQIDVDNSGALDMDEMWEAVQLLNIPLTRPQLKQAMVFFDSDKNGEIDLLEFKRWMNSQITKFWGDDSEENCFVALQRALSQDSNLQVLRSLSTRKSDEQFIFETIEEGKEENESNVNNADNIFKSCNVSEVEIFDINKIGDYINYLFIDTQFDLVRDKYVSIFMTNNVDGGKFLGLNRRHIARMGVENKRGKRHCTVVWNELRQIKKRSGGKAK